MQRIFFNFFLALEGIMDNQFRAILTALGIMFGVAAVIAMLAIGTGAKQAILDQMKLIGTNNILITSKIIDPEEEAESEGSDGGNGSSISWSPGLTLLDGTSIQQVLPNVEALSPEIIINTQAIQGGKLQRTRCVGVTNEFFNLNNLSVGQGNGFHSTHLKSGAPVCVIGKQIQAKFFPKEDPIGGKIKCGNTWLTILGVLKERPGKRAGLEDLGIRDYNADIYVPVQTALLHFKNRAKVTSASFSRGRRGSDNEQKGENYHQLDRLVVRISDAEQLQASADVIARLLKRRHQGQVDFEITVPELLLESQQRTQETFNLVLAVIAAISLLVGGIGIMNIMLASVLERIKEIGVRRSLGAHRRDIIWQFLFEAIFISLIGGLIGVLLGVGAATVIARSADIPTVVSAWSILLSFGVAAAVGLVFGLVPARRAAQQDPIKALRTD
jgi:putative ABC transport system permease protein